MCWVKFLVLKWLICILSCSHIFPILCNMITQQFSCDNQIENQKEVKAFNIPKGVKFPFVSSSMCT